MKKLVFALALGFLSMPIFAQESRRPDHKADMSPEARTEEMVKKMTKELNLNEEQVLQLQPLLLDFHKEEMASREVHKQRREDLKTELSEILDEKQMAKMEKRHQRRMKKMRKHRHERLEEIEEDEAE